MLRITDLHVRYGEMEAVRGVSLEVGAGEAVGLLGANGAGKSTILKTVMGLVPAAAGTLELDGQPLWSPARIRWSRWMSSRMRSRSASAMLGA